MRAKTFAATTDAEKWCADVATAFGMPWPSGTNVGGGKHAPYTPTATTRVVDPVAAKVEVEDAVLDAVSAKPIVDASGKVVGTEPAKVDTTGFVAPAQAVVEETPK